MQAYALPELDLRWPDLSRQYHEHFSSKNGLLNRSKLYKEHRITSVPEFYNSLFNLNFHNVARFADHAKSRLALVY
jgi:hypothetical protein